ncbi:MAG: radical SAM protein [Candidatus Hodarchaeota archaeon]
MHNITSLITQKVKPSIAVWEITLRCNSKCIHCGSRAGQSRSDELNTEEALKLIKQIRACGYKGIALMGGEPLIREDWYKLANEVKSNNLELSIVTNGLNLKKHIEKLKKLDVDCVCLSLDGGNSKTHDYLRGIKGAFQKTIEGINLLKKYRLPISVITTVSKVNFKELNILKKILLDQNIAWQIQIAIPIGRFPRDLVISEKQFYTLALFIAINVKKYSYKRLPVIGAHCMGYFSRFIPNLGLTPWIGCQAGISVLGIQSNGNIKGCLTLPDKFIRGNIREKSLKEILNDLRLEKKKLISNCINCDLVNDCKGGCLGTMYALKYKNSPYCLRAIENKFFNDKETPIRGKLDSTVSKLKNLYKALHQI